MYWWSWQNRSVIENTLTFLHLSTHASLHPLPYHAWVVPTDLSLLPSYPVPLSCHFLAEDAPECPAGSAESRGTAPGWPLRCRRHPGMCWEGGPSLAAAHAEDGRPVKAGQRFCGLLQNLWTGEGNGHDTRGMVMNTALFPISHCNLVIPTVLHDASSQF